MKRLRFFGLLVTVSLLAMGMVFFGCSSDSKNPDEVRTSTYSQTVSQGVLEVVFSNGSLAVGDPGPMSGDNYIAKLNGNTISKGKIEVNGIYITFIPDSGDNFSGSLNGDVLKVSIPYQGGFVSMSGGTGGGGASGGGGGNFWGAGTTTGTATGSTGSVSPSGGGDTPQDILDDLSGLTHVQLMALSWDNLNDTDKRDVLSDAYADAAGDPAAIAALDAIISDLNDLIIEKISDDDVVTDWLDPGVVADLPSYSQDKASAGYSPWDATHIYYVKSLIPTGNLGLLAGLPAGWEFVPGATEPAALPATGITDVKVRFYICDDAVGAKIYSDEFLICLIAVAQIEIDWTAGTFTDAVIEVGYTGGASTPDTHNYTNGITKSIAMEGGTVTLTVVDDGTAGGNDFINDLNGEDDDSTPTTFNITDLTSTGITVASKVYTITVTP